MTLLRVRNVTVRFGGVTALERVSLEVGDGSVCAIVGPKGAGKTTLFECICGVRQFDGRIDVEATALVETARQRVVGVDLGSRFATSAVPAHGTVLDHIMVGVQPCSRSGLLAHALRLPGARREERRMRARAIELAGMLDLGDALDHPVADLPPCDRKRAELARGLAAEPRLLLVDAPMAGLHRDDAAALVKRLSRLPKRVGVTVVLFEHHVHTVADDCDHVVVLDAGRKIAAGTAAEVTKHPEVVSAYLGGSAPADAESRRGKLIRLVAARRRAGAGA